MNLEWTYNVNEQHLYFDASDYAFLCTSQATGKLVFGNKLLPTSLVISFEEARLTYSTKPAACSLDHFMHFIKCKAENFKVKSLSDLFWSKKTYLTMLKWAMCLDVSGIC